MSARSPFFGDDDDGLLPKHFVVVVPIVILLACWGIGMAVLAWMGRA